MTVTKSSPYKGDAEEGTGDEGLIRVDEVTYYMNQDFAADLYDSCKGLPGVSAGTSIMDLMCGKWGSKKCNGFRWLEFMGLSHENGGHAPYQFNYVFSNERRLTVDGGRQMYPLDVRALSCSEAPPGEQKCSYADCAQSPQRLQNPPQLPQRTPPVTLFNMSATTAAALILYLIIAASVFIYFAIYSMRNDNKSESLFCNAF